MGTEAQVKAAGNGGGGKQIITGYCSTRLQNNYGPTASAETSVTVQFYEHLHVEQGAVLLA